MHFLLSAFIWTFLTAYSVKVAKAEDDPTFTNVVYLIRNAEMASSKVGAGLNATGVERAECLPNVCQNIAECSYQD